MTLTPIPEPIDSARRVLTAVLAAGPAVEDALAVSEALAVLIDVHPPYPPLGLEDDPTEPDVGIPAAIALIDEAIGTAESIPALCRYGETLVVLRRAPSAPRPIGRTGWQP